jgi:GPH family glycoside/pentoside/hexuronide:cation symporter
MTVDPTTGRLKLGLGLKVNYGIGALVSGIGGGGALPLLALYGNQVLGLPADLVGLTIMLSVIVDAVLDPLIGRW